MSRVQNRTAVSLSVILRATIAFGSGPTSNPASFSARYSLMLLNRTRAPSDSSVEIRDRAAVTEPTTAGGREAVNIQERQLMRNRSKSGGSYTAERPIAPTL